MEYHAINLAEKFTRFTEHFSPKIVAQMNDYHFKLGKFQGPFVWHRHSETDETFLVIAGQMTIEFRDGQVDLQAGEMFIVPKGVEHLPRAELECQIMMIEPAGTTRGGDSDDGYGTGEWI